MNVGVITTLYFFEDNTEKLLYAEVEYKGRTITGGYRFESVIYGWEYILSEDMASVEFNGAKYRTDQTKAWYYNLTAC